MEDNTAVIFGIILGAFAILSFIGLIIFGVYINYKLEVDNFQVTISDLSDEQKCIHICGFLFNGQTLFDNYKFCMEKCDRISEREHSQCEVIQNG